MNTMKNSRQEFRFTSEDGLQIASNRWQSWGPARDVFQIAHGLGEHSGSFQHEFTARDLVGMESRSQEEVVHPGVANASAIRRSWKCKSQG
jgi:alpha-beta hydrolase superfamily lysophospholipase